MAAPDKTQWQRLSPHLDELLDLAPAQREAALAALRTREPALAQQLEALLGQLSGPQAQDFLEQPVLPPPPALAGRQVGAYVLERELGRGGMGSVWLARRTDGRYEGQVAIKFLQAGLLGRGDAARFAREGSILARLNHPHIARLLDAGVSAEHGEPYLVLEYIAGLPLDRHCDQRGLDLPARLRLFLDVLGAVSHAHNQLVLHRDLKPSNILVTADGQVKLLDFGIAKLLDEAQPADASELTRAAGRAYTLSYAAPEQVQGGEVSTATDVYALGVLLYQLLGGPHPTADPTGTDLARARAVVEHEPRRLSDAVLRQGGPDAARRARALRGDLDTLVAKALKKAPDERYANASALADDLRRHLNHEPLAAQPDTLAYRSAKFLRRHRVGVALGTGVALALGSAAGVALLQARDARQQREQAESLVEFMLGDLRQKLQAVGRLDVLDAVGDKALAHYAAADLAQLDAHALGRRARALHLMGEIAEQRGRQAEAAQRFGEAAASTAALLQRHPDDPQRVFDHSQSEFWIGYVAYKSGRLEDAQAAFARYLAQAERLNQLDATRPAWRAEVAFAHLNLGEVYRVQRRYEQALSHLQASSEILRREAATQPGLNMELANDLGWIGQIHDEQGQYDRALQAQAQKLAALAKVPDAGHDRQVQESVAMAHLWIARARANLGQIERAAPEIEQARSLLHELVLLDPANLDWLVLRSEADLAGADIALSLGDAAAARADLTRALQADKQLNASDDRLARSRLRLRGRLLLMQHRLPDLQAPQAPALQAYLDELAQGTPDSGGVDLSQTLIAADVGLALGDRLSRAGQAGAARAAWQQALARLQALAPAGGPPAQVSEAQALLRLGRLQEARVLADSLGSSQYRHPRVAELQQRMADEKERRVGL